jgi:intracellular sulfur oxidation DsrE/DsrF family protein
MVYLKDHKAFFNYLLMKYFSLLFFFVLIWFCAKAQPSQSPSNDSLNKAQKDSAKIAMFFARATYPLIKGSKWSGVLPVENITEKPDPAITYKLLMEVVVPIKDSAAAKEVHEGLAEVGRVMNLHIASGIPKNKLNVVVVIHGPALFALYNNASYRKMYGVDNPNISLVNELEKNGVRLIACGQAMNFLDIKKEEMIPGVAVSLTAQTVLSHYQLKGYILFAITESRR